MKPHETIEVLTDIVERKIVEPRFSGIMHVEIHCYGGGVRHVFMAPQPERIECLVNKQNIDKEKC